MMHRIFHSHFMFVFLILMSLGGFSINTWGESAGTSEQMPMKPVSCQGMIEELINQLHAANQSVESLRDENGRLNLRIEEAESTIQELENTIRRIRNDVNRGGFGRVVPQ